MEKVKPKHLEPWRMIVPFRRIALVAACSEYLLKIHIKGKTLENFPQAAKDGALLKDLLQQKLGYEKENLLSNVTGTVRANCRAKDIIQHLDFMLNMARFAEKYRNPLPAPLHFFIAWSGQGFHGKTTGEYIGIDSYGELIPFGRYARVFSQFENIFVFLLINSPRPNSNYNLKSQKEHLENERHGKPRSIVLMKHACMQGIREVEASDKGQSKEVLEFCERLERVKGMQIRELVLHLKFVENVGIPMDFSIDWIIFNYKDHNERPKPEEAFPKVDQYHLYQPYAILQHGKRAPAEYLQAFYFLGYPEDLLNLISQHLSSSMKAHSKR